MDKSLGCHTKKEMIKHIDTLFKADTNIKHDLGEEMKAC